MFYSPPLQAGLKAVAPSVLKKLFENIIIIFSYLYMKKSKFQILIFVSLVAIIFVYLCISSMVTKSPVWDEPTHIASGYLMLSAGQDKLNPEHPPLFKQISAIPLKLLSLKLPYPPDFNQKFDSVNFGVTFLYNQEADADKILFLARLPSIFIALILVVFVFVCVNYMYGIIAAVFAVIFCVFDPNLLAHSRLVTNDIYLTCFFFISVYQLKRFVDEPKPLRLLYLSIFSGLTVISKFSGLVLIPCIILVLFIEIFVRKNQKLLAFLNNNKEKKCLNGLLVFLVVIIIILFISGMIIFSDYCFEFKTFEQAIDYKLNATQSNIDDYLVNEKSVFYKPIKFALTKIPIPAPSYIYGVLWHFQYSAKGHPSFLMGRYSQKGFRTYFPIVFLIKTPIILLLFFFLGKIVLIKNFKSDFGNEYILFLPPFLYFCVAIFDVFNIGYRHILPIVPFCILIASKALDWMFKKDRITRYVLIILVGYYIFGTIRIHPNYLSYFNEFIGGTKNGYRYVVDSNIDWGQDLKSLARYLEENKVNEVYLSYFGTANPHYYNIKYKPLKSHRLPEPVSEQIIPEPDTPGLYAISVTNLQGVYFDNHKIFDWLKKYEPEAIIGNSIHIYDIKNDNPSIPELNRFR